MEGLNILKENSYSCTGCGTCAASCPKKAIVMQRNPSGFLEPNLDQNLCIYCGRCINACSRFIESFKENLSLAERITDCYAVVTKNASTLKSCTSGGASFELAKALYDKGYEACGVRYNYSLDMAEHYIAGDIKAFEAAKGSKYMQSNTADTFRSLFEGLKKGKKYVVFGTPCQIYGLSRITSKRDLERLILVELFCHGTPSYNLWEAYLKHIKKKFGISKISKIAFRSKLNGWNSASMEIEGDNKHYLRDWFHDLFYTFFLFEGCLNECCYSCPFRKDISAADIRLGDFWGPRFKDNTQGVSLALVLSEKGNRAFSLLENTCYVEKVSVKDVEMSQPVRFIHIPEERSCVLEALKEKKSLTGIFYRYYFFKFLRRNLVRDSVKIIPKGIKPFLKRFLGAATRLTGKEGSR